MIRAFLIAATTIAATLIGATSSQADPTPPRCWTTFDPPAPQGAAMTQTYRNCNSHAVDVSIGFTDASGQVHHRAIAENCRRVLPGEWTVWNWSSTLPGVNYKTVLCRWAAPVAQATETADAPCWTSFVPGAPNGGRMTQRYRNCNSAGNPQIVTPAYVDSGGQITVLVDRAVFVAVGTAWKWEFERTEIGVNYSTSKLTLNPN
ncbi:hypothetical protein ACWGE0_08490 [Lentzea sp. NPDC054927]